MTNNKYIIIIIIIIIIVLSSGEFSNRLTFNSLASEMQRGHIALPHRRRNTNTFQFMNKYIEYKIQMHRLYPHGKFPIQLKR